MPGRQFARAAWANEVGRMASAHRYLQFDELSLDGQSHRLDSGDRTQLGAGLVERKIHAALGQTHCPRDLIGSLPTRRPGQHLRLAGT